MGAVGKSIFLLTTVTFLLQISDSNAAFREFQDQKRDNFEMCVGGNGKEHLYRFCQRKVSANSRECYRREDMNGVCGCTVSQSSGGKNGFFNLAINCNGDSDSADICPQQKLGLYFQSSDPINVEKTDCNCEKDASSSIQSAIICVLVVIIICLICKDRLLRYYRDFCQRRPAGTQRKAATHDGAQLFPAAETEPLEAVQIPKQEFL